MKKFNQTITVEVEVDSIAEKLLSTLKEDNPHREMITESIIGTMLHNNNLSYLYNSLNGFTNGIDFEIGDEVNCSSTRWNEDERVPIGICKIVDIDLYRREKVQVEYSYEKNGKTLINKDWVNHTKLSSICIS